MPVVRLRSAARNDLIDHFDFLEAEAGLGVATKFLDEVEASLAILATQPGMGAPLSFRDSRLAGLRKWRVNTFDNVLIFYLPMADGISVVRVLHASQDWWGMPGLRE